MMTRRRPIKQSHIDGNGVKTTLTFVPVLWAVGSGVFGFVFAIGVWYATTRGSLEKHETGLEQLSRAVREEGVRRDETRREFLQAVQQNREMVANYNEKLAGLSTQMQVGLAQQEAINKRLDTVTELLRDFVIQARPGGQPDGTGRPKR